MIKELEITIKNGKSLIFSTGAVKNKILLVFDTRRGCGEIQLCFSVNLNGEMIKATDVDNLEDALNSINSLESENLEFKEALENAEVKIGFVSLYEPGLLDIKFNSLDLDYEAIPYLFDGATMEVNKIVAFEALYSNEFREDPDFEEFISSYDDNPEGFLESEDKTEKEIKFLKLASDIDTSFTIDGSKFKNKIIESLQPLKVSIEDFVISEDEDVGHYQQGCSAFMYIEGVLFEVISSVFSGSPT